MSRDQAVDQPLLDGKPMIDECLILTGSRRRDN